MQFETIKQLLDNLAQPAFAAQDGTVVYANRPAREKMLKVGDAVEQYRAADGVFSLQGTEYDANMQELDGCTLYFLASAKDSSPLSPAIFRAAQNIREPLMSLFSASSSLFPKLEALENEELQEELSHLNRAYFRLMRLACNLSDLYAALDGQMRLHYEKTEMTDYFYNIFIRTESLCELCGIRLSVRLHPQTFFAWIDRQKVERLILNLISNAVKFSRPGSEIALELSKIGSFAVISVSDQGEGLSEQALSETYSRFARPLSVEDSRNGLGAGLTLCRTIAELHGGSMMLCDNSPSGTRVTVRLPLNKPDAQALVESPLAGMDYTGGLSHTLVELADVLPCEAYSTENVN